MLKSTMARIILITTIVLVLIAIVLFVAVAFNEKDTSVIKVKLDSGENEKISFENLALIPGEQCEYEIELSVGSVKKYDLKLEFAEKKDGALKRFACAKVIVDGKVVFDDVLFKLFEKGTIELPIDLSEKDNTKIDLIYYLPDSIGNEAQETEATFDLIITANN